MKLPKLKTWHWLALVGIGIGGYFLASKKPAVASKPVDSPPPPKPDFSKRESGQWRPHHDIAPPVGGQGINDVNYLYGIDTGSQSVLAGAAGKEVY